jgi:RHS repeat-associated protein
MTHARRPFQVMRPHGGGPVGRALVLVVALLAQVVVALLIAPAVSPAAAVNPGTAGNYVPIAGTRLVDTRPAYAVGGYNTPQPGSSTWRAYQAAGVGNVPGTGVAAIMVSVTVLSPSANGWMQLAPNTSRPALQTTFLSFEAGDTVTNTGIVQLGTDGQFAVRAAQASNILVDVQGYFTQGDGMPAPGGFVSVPNFRLADSRDGTGGVNGVRTAGSTTTYTLGGTNGVPTTATAAFVAITVVSPNARGFLIPYATGSARPNISLNFQPTQIQTISTSIDLNSSGQFNLYLDSAAADIVIDVQGYFDGQPSSSGYTPVNARLFNTQGTASGLVGGTVTQVQIAGTGGIPAASASLTGVMLNLQVSTRSGSVGNGYLKVWPSDESEPAQGTAVSFASTDQISSNSVVVRPGADGKINIRSAAQNTAAPDLTLDAQGFFQNENALSQASSTQPTKSGSRSATRPVSKTLTDRSRLVFNPTNGNLLYQQSLLSLAGVGARVSIGVRYNSLNDHRPTLNVGQFEAQLFRKSDGTLTYTGPDGGGYDFTPKAIGGSTYNMPNGINATLKRTTGLDGAAGAQYKLQFHPSQITNVYVDNGTSIVLQRTEDVTGGNVIGYSYGTSLDKPTGKLVQIIDTQGRHIDFTYASTVNPTQPTTITDVSMGRTINLTYAGPGGALSKIVDATGATTLFGYGANGRLAQLTDDRGNVTKMTYDATLRFSTVTSGFGTSVAGTWTMAYNAPCTTGRSCTTWTDPNSHQSKFEWDTAKLQVLKFTDPKSNAVSSTWNNHNDLMSQKSARDEETKFNTAANTYNLTQITAPTGDPGGTGTAGRTAQYEFTAPTGTDDSTFTTADYRPTSVTDAQGNKTEIQFWNSWGQATQVTTPGGVGGTSTFTYHGDGGVTCGATARSGQLCKVTDGEGNITTFSYTEGNLTTVTPPSPLGAQTFTYDAAGRVKSHTDGRGVTSYSCYDNNDRVVQTGTSVCTTPGGVRYTYDGAGNMTQRISTAGTSTYSYDAQNRPFQKADGFGYAITTAVTYDAAGNVLTYDDGTGNGTVGYRYDDADNLIYMSEPGGSCPATPAFPNSTRCIKFDYDANNQRTKTTFPTGANITTAYDTSKRIKTIVLRNTATSILTQRSYTYATAATAPKPNADSGVLQTMSTDGGATTTTYGYDVLNQLTSAKTGSVTDQWTYDHNGNRLTSKISGVTTNAQYNGADQQCWSGTGTSSSCTAPTGATSYSWDGNGNQTAGDTANTWTQSYDQLSKTGSTTYTYAGSTNNERVSAGSTAFGNGILGAVTSTRTGTTVKEYLRDNKGTLIAMRTGGASYYYTADMLGSVINMTDSSQTTVASYSYGTWGDTLTATGTQAAGNPWRFATGYTDATGLIKMGARYYQPTTGRFTQPDPSGQEKNRYAYAGNNPTTYNDPTGMNSLLEGLSVGFDFASALFPGPVGAVLGGISTGLTVTDDIVEGDYDEIAGDVVEGAVGMAVGGAASRVAGEVFDATEGTADLVGSAAGFGYSAYDTCSEYC